jgi:drug/metabolite transporter (DMT)-like permease
MWIKIALRETNPEVLVAFRVSFGLLFGIAVIIIQRVSVRYKFKEWLPLLVLGITNIAVPFFLISCGELSVNSSVAAILDSTVPLFTIFLAHFFLDDDKFTLPKLAGLVVGFSGVVILLSKSNNSSSSTFLGQMAIILASVFYAGSAVYVRRTTQDFPGILRSAGPLLSASLLMWIAVFLTEDKVQIPSLNITWGALLFLGIIGSGLAFLMAFYLIHEIGPTRTSMVTYIFPLGGVILGVIFLHEQITRELIIGGILILASLVITNRQPSRKLSVTRMNSEDFDQDSLTG